MTKKDYALVAAALKESVQEINDRDTARARLDQMRVTALNLSKAMAQDNPNFSKTKFLVACGLED